MPAVDSPTDDRTTLSQRADGTPFPPARDRVRSRLRSLDDRWVGWLAPIGVALIAFGMRVWRLGSPDRLAFDETYYAKDAWAMANHGYVRRYIAEDNGTKINDLILDGRTQDIWSDGPSRIVHPEVGKWMIALGEMAFGMDSFGWRISAAVVGALMVLVIARLVRRLTGSTMLGCVAGLLLMLDGLHFTLSRIALLDIFLAFWLLCGVACLVNDRDWHRSRLGRGDAASTWGPRSLYRPWLLVGGVCFGLAIGTKWTALYPLAAFGLLVWIWSSGARRSLGVRWPIVKSALLDGVPAFAQLVLVAFVVYVASWGGWLMNADEYEEAYAYGEFAQFVEEKGCVGAGDDRRPDIVLDEDKHWPTGDDPDASGLGEVRQSLRSLVSYHQDLYVFHTHYLNCSTHTYQSRPSGWLFINRPVGAATDLEVEPGEQGCDAQPGETCYRQVLLIGTPLIWWGGTLALIASAVLWAGSRDWRFGVAVTGALSTWLPWLLYDDRPIFFFYAIATLPFLVIATALVLGKLIGPSRDPTNRRTIGVIVGGSFLVLALLNFAYFYPILSYEVITRNGWEDRMWFQRWI